MASMNRFDVLTDEQINSFLEEQNSTNTKKATCYTIRLVQKYLSECLNITNCIEELPPTILRDCLIRFFTGVKKVDGSSYEPSTLVGFYDSIARHLRGFHYKPDLKTGEVFNDVKAFLKAASKKLKKDGFGNLPRSLCCYLIKSL